MPENWLTRAETERTLERLYLGRIISCEIPIKRVGMREVSGIIQQMAVEVRNKELILSFQINNKRYSTDVNYFIQHAKIHGNTYRAAGADTTGL